ncbi:MAG TPA: YfhO family protein, partial [Verrucomicrobiae bacterium]|nr:YfhO family protein [Verrucomicrobiae bacterium]
AFGGVFLFARRWGLAPVSAALAGVLFTFGGYLVCITNNLPYLMAAAGFPAALWASDRFFCAPTLRRATPAACLLALVLFAGDPQSFATACGLTLVIGAVRRPRRAAAAAAGLLTLTVLVAAVQLLAALQVATEGKPAAQSLEAAEAWSLHPLRALDVALGPLFASESGDPVGASISRALLGTSRNNLWVNSLHLGLPALVLAGVALAAYRKSPRTWVLATCTVVVALLALGKHAPVYGLLFRLVPPWRAFRYPEKLAPYVAFGLALGAAAGLHAAQSDDRVRRRAAVALGAATTACVALVVLERAGGVFSQLLVPALWHGVPPREALARLSTAFVHHALESGSAALLVMVVLAGVRPRELRGALVVVAVFVHLLLADGPLYEVAPSSVLHAGAFVRAIEAAEGPARLGGWRVHRLKGGYGTDYARDAELAALDERAQFARSVESALDPVTPALWGLEGANDYLPGTSRRVADLADDETERAARWGPLFAARYLSVAKADVRDLDRRAVDTIAKDPALWLVLLRQRAARARVYLARPRCVATREQAWHALASIGPDAAVVECPEPLPAAPASAPLGEVEIVAYAPERIRVRADVRGDALLVLNDAFYSGWRAEVDGRPAPILPANYAVRGVPLRPGAHAVVFAYRTPGLVYGAWTSAVALGLALIVRR